MTDKNIKNKQPSLRGSEATEAISRKTMGLLLRLWRIAMTAKNEIVIRSRVLGT